MHECWYPEGNNFAVCNCVLYWPFILEVVWDWVHLVRRPLIGLLYQPQMMVDNECGAVGGMRIGRGNRNTRRNPAPMPRCPPQTPHAAKTRTPAAPVGSQRLTAWAMARHSKRLVLACMTSGKFCIKFSCSLVPFLWRTLGAFPVRLFNLCCNKSPRHLSLECESVCNKLAPNGRAIAQSVSRWLSTAAARVQNRV
jgi:hypothetical protein